MDLDNALLDEAKLNIGTDKKYSPTAEELFEKYGNTVWRLALARTGKEDYADDVLQEVFLRLVRKNPEFADEEHSKAWLIKVCINCSKTLFQSAWMRHYAPLDGDMLDKMGDDRDLYLAVYSLPQKIKTCIHLYYYEDMSVSSISELLGISQSAVKQRLMRGREKLKDYFTGDEKDV